MRMAVETAPNLTPEDRRLLVEMREAEREAEKLPPPSRELQARMDDEEITSAALSRPGPARDAHHEVMSMPRDEFEAEYADVLNRNAYDEDVGANG